MSMSTAQTAAFTAAAGQSPGAVATLLILIAGALVVLWAADMVRRLGTEGLREPDRLWTASNAGEVVAYGLDGALQLELPTRERDIYAFACGPRGEVAVGEDSGACELWLDPERPGRRFAASSAVHARRASSTL